MMYAEDACPARAARPVCGPDARLGTGTVPITVMVCSDRVSLLSMIRTLQARTSGICLLAAPRDGEACLHTCMSPFAPRVLLFDKDWLDLASPRLLHRLREHRPQVRILLTWDRVPPTLVADVAHHLLDGFLPAESPPELCYKAIEAVIHGELWLSREMMTQAIAALHMELHAAERHTVEHHAAEQHGDTPVPDIAGALTRRETEVVIHLRRGFTNKEIARELGIMEDTVKKHLQNIFAKLGVKRRTLVALSRPGQCTTG